MIKSVERNKHIMARSMPKSRAVHFIGRNGWQKRERKRLRIWPLNEKKK